MNEPLKKADIVSQAKQNAPASEATHIEQSRAIAQVQGALVVAQQKPRDTLAAAERMREACLLETLAENAFFRYSRAGSQITGPSIHLATELARCWGNVDFGITELRRDERKQESEMLAHAWDLETNTRVVNSFIVPHRRDTRNGPKDLTDVRDIYENNANHAARRLRECIFRVLPKSYIEEAKGICAQTLEHGGGEPIDKRREKLLEAFAGLKVTRAQVEKKIGRSADRLTAYDIGALRVVYGSLKRGETTIDDEFPSDRGAEISRDLADQPKAPPPQQPKREPYTLVNEIGEVVEEITGSGTYAEALIGHFQRVKEPKALATLWENNADMVERMKAEGLGDHVDSITSWHAQREEEIAEAAKQDAQPEPQKTPADEPQEAEPVTEPDGRPAPPDETEPAGQPMPDAAEASEALDDEDLTVPLTMQADGNPDWIVYYKTMLRKAREVGQGHIGALKRVNAANLEEMAKKSKSNFDSLHRGFDKIEGAA